MASYVKFELSDGTSVYIETTDTPRGSSGLIPRAAEVAEQKGHEFDEVIAPVSKLAQSMLTGLRGSSEADDDSPSEVSVSFGLRAAPELGALVVARTGGDNNFNVSLRWNKHKPEEKDAEKKK
jgi:hypothetical protein